MKKLNLLIIVAILASALLMAATPTKLVRLTIKNNSGDTVYMKLTGEATDAFYYLTIPDEEEMVFTVYSDIYARETWACDGVKSKGKLIMTGNVRLNFVECGTIPLRWVGLDTNGDGLVDTLVQRVNKGEPTMEKVAYFKYWAGTAYWFGCGFWAVSEKTFKIPTGCYFRYRY